MNAGSGGRQRHVPVLLDAVLDGLAIRPDGTYIDATFGRGGHSRAILARLGGEGRLLAVDRDPQAIAEADPALLADPRFELTRNDIAQLESIAASRQWQGRINGLFMDLGVSSPQLDDASRGFSFQSNGPLDMRMDPDSGIGAAEWLSTVELRSLRRVLFELGEERQADRIARAIVNARSRSPLTTTGQLAELVESVAPRRGQKRHPATRTFQAIRMFVNAELEQLASALSASTDLLARGGRLCVISFHSLEDRMVKRFMRDASREAEAYRGMPNVPEDQQPRMKLVGKPVKATAAEIAANPRSRSAHLRVAEENAMKAADKPRAMGLTLVFAAVCMLSAFAVIYTKHESRKLFVELEALTSERDALNIEWGQLQIEQSTWATHGRIEQVANDKLSLVRPEATEVFVIERP